MVNEWNKTAFVKFETMLRRRLRSGAAPVTACAGFDLDSASAYLEGALGGSHRVAYESHLAGCATCRRSLIELSRLAQTAALMEPQILVMPTAAEGPGWDRWKAALTAWFDLSSLSLKWRLAGATGAAFAILLAALGAQSWRQAYRQHDLATRMPNTADGTHSAPGVDSSTPDPFSHDEAITKEPKDSDTKDIKDGLASINQQYSSVASLRTSDLTAPDLRERSRVPAPAPPVGLQLNAPKIAYPLSNRSLALNPNQPIEAPAAPRELPTPKPADASLTPDRPQRQNVLPSAANLEAFNDAAFGGSQQDLSQEPPKKVLHSFKPRGNPMIKGFVESDPESSKSVIENVGNTMREMLNRIPLVGPRLSPSSEPERKAAAAQETAGARSHNPLITKINGKIFHLEKGVLIDQEYKPEMEKWARWTLRPDSKEYKEILEKDPSLTVFFERGPILIVWKNGIYKVLK
ncbi:MAG: zf-HC2 domain-containing protein [Chloracidobacterium sp.]|nr:zf-HC2 domain-containing protein [Chloracidobacterium sp.]